MCGRTAAGCKRAKSGKLRYDTEIYGKCLKRRNYEEDSTIFSTKRSQRIAETKSNPIHLLSTKHS